MIIKDIFAHEILDSRGNPTVETTVKLENGVIATASVPSGASTGVHEALELRDKDEKRYHGQGVLKAVENVNTVIKNALVGKPIEQNKIDNLLLKLDGTEFKTNLGANAILSVSLACLKAGAMAHNKELYEYVSMNALANDFNFKVSNQIVGILISELCRNPEDLSQPFRYVSSKTNKDYKMIRITEVPKYISPYTAITSENPDEAVAAALTTSGNNRSPLEKIMMS